VKELLTLTARYNRWANAQLATALKSVPDAVLDAETPSSFPTLRRTVAHLRAAEQTWMDRLALVENPAWLGEDLGPSFSGLVDAWTAASGALVQFVEKQYNDRAFQHVVEYRDLRGASHKTPVGAVLQHVFHHSAYHRGQLVTMMRALGESKIPRTDFILFQRGGK